MLIELTVSNFRSIRDEQHLNLVAGREKIHQDSNVFEPEQPIGRKRLRLLRSAALYGPNASGKTNLIKALATMQRMVLTSQQAQSRLPVVPFLFDLETSRPTLLEVVILVEGVRYQYGFSATRERIHDEWLFAFPKGRAQRWFEREFFPDEAREKFTLGDGLAGDKEVWRRATRPDALFLSTAVYLNSQQLLPVFNWFRDKLQITGIGGWSPNLSLEWCQNDNKQRILKFLQAADFGITDLRIEEVAIDPKRLPSDLPSSIREFLLDEIGEGQGYTLISLHEANDEHKKIRLPFGEESDGTQKMFNLAAPWLNVLERAQVLFVDELHDNLHPLLVQFLIRFFHSKETNPKGAQLVFTTHETSILNDEYLRRDQIWFFERDRDQSTRIYPLTKFKLSKGAENVAQDYLVGCYGAVPFLENPAEILGS
uniref:ATPase AAA-type core domain-containing protein n=1 Tax=Candidatus Kentrum sp. TUN TaxID=2126343 RepID=A0A450ZF94_9GAMM|nr:MAG: hypothetical protein BECKTUN1418F_GA0071002_100839 [Candidatus Kentron sp. TUN]VFK52964.1 MAG: hypothetical protein BECKTUN1418E_GA0071001_101139 [Candidatus Kentron sp. TUN]VFK57953.1 MAG: hypothetical protein BECKTUN1418D_GA0071000_107213 [Candidatus Kentron sp. TUN]